MRSNIARRERDEAPTWFTMSSNSSVPRGKALERSEFAVEPDDGWAADLQVNVAHPTVDGLRKQGPEVKPGGAVYALVEAFSRRHNFSFQTGPLNRR